MGNNIEVKQKERRQRVPYIRQQRKRMLSKRREKSGHAINNSDENKDNKGQQEIQYKTCHVQKFEVAVWS
jgi:hypothetical protein